MRSSDWSSDVCSSDLRHLRPHFAIGRSHFACGNDDRSIGAVRSDPGPCRRREFPRLLHSPSRRQALVAQGGGHQRDRKSVVAGKSVSVGVSTGGRGIIKKKKKHNVEKVNSQQI